MRPSIPCLSVLFLLSACAEEKASISLTRDAAQAPSTATDAGSTSDAGRPSDAGRGGNDKPATDASTSGSGGDKIDRSGLKNVGTDPLDYADRALWACRPGNDPNECHSNLDATEVLPDGTTQLVKHERAENPEFDCFYIYPTVATSGGGNMTDFSDLSRVRDPLLGQGARFSRVCEVYAPLYRQVSLTTSGDAGVQRQGDPALAVGDVLAAFDHYMKELNKGRKFVILGHSQGSSMGIELLKARIDANEELRKQMISAVLLGSGPVVPKDADVGGTFKNIPTCSEPGETGCLIAYVSYAKDAPPPANGLFGRATPAGVVACTEPAALAGNTSGTYRGSYFARVASNPAFQTTDLPPDLTTPYVLYRNLFTGKCVQTETFSYLEISVAQADDDKRTVPGYRALPLEPMGWGLHLVDYSLEVDDLIDAVKMQADAAK